MVDSAQSALEFGQWNSPGFPASINTATVTDLQTEVADLQMNLIAVIGSSESSVNGTLQASQPYNR
jgi:hypothetical protein